jgi:hypothetical protein
VQAHGAGTKCQEEDENIWAGRVFGDTQPRLPCEPCAAAVSGYLQHGSQSYEADPTDLGIFEAMSFGTFVSPAKGAQGSLKSRQDLWKYDTITETFTEISLSSNPAEKPSARYGHRMAGYDGLGSKAFYLYGGIDDGGTTNGELWKFDAASKPSRKYLPPVEHNPSRFIKYLGCTLFPQR